MEIIFKEIGIIKTEFDNKAGIPIQAAYGSDHCGEIKLYPEYTDGLKDLDGFSHIHLIYYFDRHKDYSLHVVPYMDKSERGLFATRAPKRPNGIGLSLVELVSVENNIIHFRGVDIMNNTPLLDIKPFYNEVDTRCNARCGWLDDVKKNGTVSDSRF